MNPFSAARYDAPRAGLPLIVAIFKDEQLVACFEADSRERADEFIDRALEWLPALERERDLPAGVSRLELVRFAQS